MVNLARQLSFGAILLVVSDIYGIAKLWDGADPDRARQRQRIYDLVAATATVIILAAGTPARRANLLVDQLLGWPAVALWLAFCLPVGITAVLVGRICLREMLTGDITRRERVVFVVIFCTAVVAGLEWAPPSSRHSDACWQISRSSIPRCIARPGPSPPRCSSRSASRPFP
ncbi:hypothetical protein [Nocardia sp. bgisy134]|uniref:hypothetical protein n=1 Tax=Nocardia sp. bgisy134 TaxID=3413789 RepID=UPI003D74641B